MKNKKNRLSAWWVILLLLLLVALGGVFTLSDGFQDSMSEMYLIYDGQSIFEREVLLDFSSEKSNKISVRFALGDALSQEKDYDVSVFSASDEDIVYEAGKKKYTFTSGEDYTDCFSIEKEKGEFRFYYGDTPTLQSVLEQRHSAGVFLPEREGEQNACFFVVVVEGASARYTISFKMGYKSTLYLNLDKESITF